jgi:hypothetical protein
VGASAFHRSLWPEILRRYEAGDEMKAIAEDLGIDRKTSQFGGDCRDRGGRRLGNAAPNENI